MNNEVFDWGSLGESKWRELADGTGASELQLRFSASRFSGASATAAARMAGYSGDAAALRRAGYAAVRSTAVQNLLELAAINAPGDARISAKEIDAKIAKLIRSSDSNVSLKAMELHAKRTAALQAEDQEEELPFDQAMEREAKALLGSVYSGLLGVTAMYLNIVSLDGPRLSFRVLPLFEQLAPNIKAEFPEIWERILNKLDSDCRKRAEQLALAAPADVQALAAKEKEVAHVAA